MAIFHKCDRCLHELAGTVEYVIRVLWMREVPTAANPIGEPRAYELCNECAAQLRRFVEGCSIPESYRR